MIARQMDLSNGAIRNFINGDSCSSITVDLIAEFVWKRLNAHLLICDEDKI